MKSDGLKSSAQEFNCEGSMGFLQVRSAKAIWNLHPSQGKQTRRQGLRSNPMIKGYYESAEILQRMEKEMDYKESSPLKM